MVIDAQDELCPDAVEDQGHFAVILELEVVVVTRRLVVKEDLDRIASGGGRDNMIIWTSCRACIASFW